MDVAGNLSVFCSVNHARKPAKEGASSPVLTTPVLGSVEQLDKLQHENDQMKIQMLELNLKLDLLAQGTDQQAMPAHPMNVANTGKRTRCEESARQAHHHKEKKQKKDIPQLITEYAAGPSEVEEDHEVSASAEIVSKAINVLVGFKDSDGLDDNTGDCLSTFLIAGSTLEPKLKN